jgi:hypothetical protein
MSRDDNAPAATGASQENSGEGSDIQHTTDAVGASPTGEPSAIDVTTFAERPSRPQIIEGVWPLRSFFAIASEEGDGKTLMADQTLRQIIRGERVLDFFDLGDAKPQKILFVDTEMEEEDAAERNDEMVRRGLGVERNQFYWFSTGGLALDQDDGVKMLEGEIGRIGADLVWIDSGINAVSEAEEGVAVKFLFNNLSKLMRGYGLLGIGLSLHTRKRAQGATGRTFDDLFGSREWKGRLGTLVYFEGERIWSWKNRGGRLARLFKRDPGKKPWAVLNRPGLSDESVVPFTVTYPTDQTEQDDAEIEAKLREILTAQPDAFTKTTLAGQAGGRKEDTLKVIGHLQLLGEVVPNERRAKLRLASSEAETRAAQWKSAADGESSQSGSL